VASTDRPDELAFAGSEHLDPAYVEGYDAKAAFDPADDLAELRELELDAEATLVDLGAGTGTFALAAAAVCRRVVAVDVSPAMVAVLRARAAGLGNVEVVEAGFLTYRHMGPPAHCVYTRNALHHLPDAWKAVALSRVAQILRPGGVLLLRDLVYACDPDELEDVVVAWIAAGTERAADGWTRVEREEHVRGEFSTFSWLLEEMLERAGFAVERAEFRSGIYADYVCRLMARPAPARPPASRGV
jgi:SAM-dependent methyltransferase